MAYLIITALCMILATVAMVALPIYVATVACDDGCAQAMTKVIFVDIVFGMALGKSL